MKKIYFALINLFACSLTAQNVLPIKDTIIENGEIQIQYKVLKHAVFMTTYKNGKWNGICKSFYKNGALWSEDTRVDGKINGKAISYTPSGSIAVIEEWENGVLKNKKIFYQNTFAEPQKYFFVSKEGFDLIKEGIR